MSGPTPSAERDTAGKRRCRGRIARFVWVFLAALVHLVWLESTPFSLLIFQGVPVQRTLLLFALGYGLLMEWGVNRYLRAPLWAMVSSALLWVALGWGFLLVIGQQSGDTVEQLLRLLAVHNVPFLVFSLWLFLAGLLMGEILYSHHHRRCLHETRPLLRVGEGISIVLPLARWKRSLLFVVAVALVLGAGRLGGFSMGVYQLASGEWRIRPPAGQEKPVSPSSPKREEAEAPPPEREEGEVREEIRPAVVSEFELPPGVNPDLPVHRRARLHPELFDPVLGDQASIVEWAWSPQYARMARLPVEQSELPDGSALWLVGVKVLRVQHRARQRYECRILGLIDNRLPIIWPPGERYMIHPAYGWFGGLPGRTQKILWGGEEEIAFTPGTAAWYKRPETEREKRFPERGIGASYLFFYREAFPGLAYFELEGGCGYFNDPEEFRNELRFPTRIDGVDDEVPGEEAVYEPSAEVFPLPDGLMRRIYPYVREAHVWGGCLGRRVEGRKVVLWEKERFKGLCERKGSLKNGK